MKVTILGCGSSSGVPHIGGEFPANPKNIRLRASVHIEGEHSALLIDTSPDLRQQALANKLKRVDALLYTHTHSDHLNGIDDIKSFNHIKQAAIDIYGDDKTIDEITTRFAYCFRPAKPEYGWYRPALVAHKINMMEKFKAAEFDVTPFLQNHGPVNSVGYRIGGFIYSTDVKAFPPESEDALYNADIWVIDCLRHEPAPTHAHLELTLKWIDKYKPKHAILTHMNHQMDYDELKTLLPSNVEPAYDGLSINLD